jgi:hypothetical protein
MEWGLGMAKHGGEWRYEDEHSGADWAWASGALCGGSENVCEGRLRCCVARTISGPHDKSWRGDRATLDIPMHMTAGPRH